MEFETFRDSLPTVVRAGEKAAVSSAEAWATLCQGHAHLRDHRQDMAVQADKVNMQSEEEKQTAGLMYARANGWWWASAAVSVTGIGALLWLVEKSYRGKAAEAEHRAATLSDVESAFRNILDPAFLKLSTVFLQNAFFFGEQKDRLEDFIEEGNLALQGMVLSCVCAKEVHIAEVMLEMVHTFAFCNILSKDIKRCTA